MKSEKGRHTVWLSDSAWEQVKSQYRADNCSTQNEFIEKAILFYAGYLNAEHASAFMPRVLTDVLEGALSAFGNRLGRHFFKLEVEQNITNHILSADTDIDIPTYEKLRGCSVREVGETNGRINFKDALVFQKSL